MGLNELSPFCFVFFKKLEKSAAALLNYFSD